MKIRKTLSLIATVACFIILTQSVSASTLDLLFNYSIIGSLQERIDVERLNIVDIDSSGIPEILVVTTGKAGTPYTELKNTIYLFNPNGSIRWRYGFDREILASLIKDINNDKNIETVVSTGLMQENIPRGTIRIINQNGDVIREYSRTSLVTTMYIDDMNNDKYYELITGSQSKLTLLFIDGEKIWDYPEKGNGTLNASVQSASTIDIDNDGEKEVMFGSTGVYLLSTHGKYICGYEIDGDIDPHKRQVNYIRTARLTMGETPGILAATATTNKVYALGLKNVVGQTDSSGNKVYTAELETKWSYEFYNKINVIKLYDLDKDNFDEVVVANEDGNIYLLDNTGVLLWTFRLDDAAKDFAIADVENDNETEVIVQSSGGSIYALDLKGNFHWRHDTNLKLEKLAVGDIDNDEMQEIVVTTIEPRLYAFRLNQSFVQKTKADDLYAQAERLFLSSSYMESREYLLKARDVYSRLGFESDVGKTQSLIDRIDSKMSEERRKLADVYYEKAQEYYISGDYKMSVNYVAMAKQIYAEFGDADNVLKCELLELRISTISGQTTLAVSTTSAKNQTASETTGINLNQAIFFGIILILAIALILYLKKKSSEQKIEAAPKEAWEDELSKIDKMDFDLGGGKDEA